MQTEFFQIIEKIKTAALFIRAAVPFNKNNCEIKYKTALYRKRLTAPCSTAINGKDDKKHFL